MHCTQSAAEIMGIRIDNYSIKMWAFRKHRSEMNVGSFFHLEYNFSAFQRLREEEINATIQNTQTKNFHSMRLIEAIESFSLFILRNI